MPLHFEKLNQLTRTLKSTIYRDAIPLETWRICDKLAYGTPLPADGRSRLAGVAAGRIVGRADVLGVADDRMWPSRINSPAKPVALHLELEPLLSDPAGSMLTFPEALVTIAGLDTPPQAINPIHPEVLLAEHAQPRHDPDRDGVFYRRFAARRSPRPAESGRSGLDRPRCRGAVLGCARAARYDGRPARMPPPNAARTCASWTMPSSRSTG